MTVPRQIRRMKLKICVVGDRAVGKTSLIQRYVFNTFSEAYVGTLGAKLHLLEFSKEIAARQLVQADIALFDVMGEHGSRDQFRDALFWGSHGFLAVSDLSRPETLDSLIEWVNTVRSVAGAVPYRILLNKADLLRWSSLDPVTEEILSKLFPNVPYSLVSAKTGAEVDRAMTLLLEEVVDGVLAKSRARRAGRLAGNRILAFALRRGPTGVTKNEILLAFKDLDHNALMREIEDLARTGLVSREEIGPANFRIVLTEEGREAASKLNLHDHVVEEPT